MNFIIVILKGFKPLTLALEGRCSIQLSYRTVVFYYSVKVVFYFDTTKHFTLNIDIIFIKVYLIEHNIRLELMKSFQMLGYKARAIATMRIVHLLSFRKDLNPQHLPYKGNVLPIELLKHFYCRNDKIRTCNNLVSNTSNLSLWIAFRCFYWAKGESQTHDIHVTKVALYHWATSALL